MIVTIIGSLKDVKEINKCQSYFEQFSDKVNSPAKDQKNSLIEGQMNWINKIKEADLIVAIPKSTIPDYDAISTTLKENFGESTSYEIAIAAAFQKPIVFWIGFIKGDQNG